MTDDTTKPSGRPARMWLIASGALLAVVLMGLLPTLLIPWATGGNRDANLPPEFTVTGTLVLVHAETAGAGCVGHDRFRDIQKGTPLAIATTDGTKLALGRLAEGVSTPDGGTCRYEFKFIGVRSDVGFYEIGVGNRESIRYARAELDNPVTIRLD